MAPTYEVKTNGRRETVTNYFAEIVASVLAKSNLDTIEIYTSGRLICRIHAGQVVYF